MGHVSLKKISGLLFAHLIMPLWGYGYADTAKEGSDEKMPRSWYMLPEEVDDKNYDGTEWEEPDEDFEDEVDDLFEAQGDSYDRLLEESQFANKALSDWELWVIRSQLAVSAGGSIGVLALKGQVATEIRWFKKSALKSAEADVPFEEPVAASFAWDTPQSSIDSTLEKIATTAYRSGKVKNRTLMLKGLKDGVAKARAMIHAVPDTSVYEWSPYRFRLRFSFAASGQAVSFLEVGGTVTVRFDFEVRPSQFNKDKSYSPRDILAADSFARLVKSFSEDMGVFVQREPFGTSWKVKNFQVIIGQAASGSVGVAKLKGVVSGRLYFKRNRVNRVKVLMPDLPENATFDYLTDDSEKSLSNFAQLNNIKRSPVSFDGPIPKSGSIYKIDRSRFRKGLIKAEKMARFFTKRASKNKQEYWKLKELRTEFKLSLGGSVGIAKLTGFGEIRVEYNNVNW